MEKHLQRFGLVLAGLALVLVALAVVHVGIAEAAQPAPVGCLCPLGTFTGTGTLEEGVDPTFLRPNTFAYGGSCSYGGSAYEYDKWGFEFCDKIGHDLTAQTTTGGDSYIEVYYNGGAANPFDPSQNGCYHAICADDDGAGNLRSKCTIPSAANLTGFVDVVVSSFSTTAMGAYTVQLDTSKCSGPKVEGVDFAMLNVADVCYGAPLKITWTVTNTGDADQPDNPTGVHLGGYEFVGTLLGGWSTSPFRPGRRAS
jgi:hypothetical protein